MICNKNNITGEIKNDMILYNDNDMICYYNFNIC